METKEQNEVDRTLELAAEKHKSQILEYWGCEIKEFEIPLDKGPVLLQVRVPEDHIHEEMRQLADDVLYEMRDVETVVGVCVLRGEPSDLEILHPSPVQALKLASKSLNQLEGVDINQAISFFEKKNDFDRETRLIAALGRAQMANQMLEARILELEKEKENE